MSPILFIHGINGAPVVEIKKFFSRFGKVVFCEKQNDKNYLFLEFSELKEMESCLDASKKDGIYFNNVKMTVKISDKNYGRTKKNRIWIGGLTNSITRKDLETYFSVYGKIEDIFIKNANPPFAFITFNSAEIVKNNILTLIHIINNVQVTVKKAIADKYISSKYKIQIGKAACRERV